MRSVFLSVVLGVGALGLSLAVPAQARADDFRGRASTNGYTPVAQYYGGRGVYPWGGYRYYYPGVNYFRGMYPYGGYGIYGGGRSSYYPRSYGGGYYPGRGRYGRGPYSGFYNTPGYFW